MEPYFLKYPKIPQFNDIVLSYSKGKLDIPNPVTFTGTVKLHGTNASFQYDVATHTVYAGKRNSLILTEKDNHYNFSDYLNDNLEDVLEACNILARDFPEYDHLAIFGEYAGGNIQSGVGICNEPKRFYPFEVMGKHKDTQEIHTIPMYIIFQYLHYYNFKVLLDVASFRLVVDLDNPLEVRNQLVEITEQVEKQCPVAKYYGHEGIGEGVVWSYTNIETLQTTRFKVKGTKHSTTKVKTLASVDLEKIESANKFAEYAVTENRVRQAMQETDSTTLQDIGKVIKWVCQDVLEEEKDTLEANNLTWKQANKGVTLECKAIYLELIK